MCGAHLIPFLFESVTTTVILPRKSLVKVNKSVDWYGNLGHIGMCASLELSALDVDSKRFTHHDTQIYDTRRVGLYKHTYLMGGVGSEWDRKTDGGASNESEVGAIDSGEIMRILSNGDDEK
jgi:hypothetical protein